MKHINRKCRPAPSRLPCLDFGTMQRLVRYARYWDRHLGTVRYTLPLKLCDDPFGYFMPLSDWRSDMSGFSHRIALERKAKLVAQWLVLEHGLDK